MESYFCTLNTYHVFQQRHIQNIFKYLRWCVFAYPINDFKVLNVYGKTFHLRCSGFCVRLRSGCTCNVFCHHNNYLMGYFEFLHGLRIICLPLNISEKLHWQCLRKTRRSRNSSPSYLLIRYNTNAPWRRTSTIQTNEDHLHFFIWIPIL